MKWHNGIGRHALDVNILQNLKKVAMFSRKAWSDLKWAYLCLKIRGAQN